jgi:hypothetical protein
MFAHKILAQKLTCHRQKFVRRTKIIQNVITLKTESNAPDLVTWKYFQDVVDLLGVDGQSSEYSAVDDLNGQPINVYRVKLVPWRDPRLTEYLHWIDIAATEPALKDRFGNIRPRVYVEESSEVMGYRLPKAMYRADWLAAQEASRPLWVEKTLCVSERAFSYLQLATSQRH